MDSNKISFVTESVVHKHSVTLTLPLTLFLTLTLTVTGIAGR